MEVHCFFDNSLRISQVGTIYCKSRTFLIFSAYLFLIYCHNPTPLNPNLDRPYFPKINQTTPQTKTDPHFFSAPSQPNSTKFSMQPYFIPTRRFMQKKIGSDAPQGVIFPVNSRTLFTGNLGQSHRKFQLNSAHFGCCDHKTLLCMYV